MCLQVLRHIKGEREKIIMYNHYYDNHSNHMTCDGNPGGAAGKDRVLVFSHTVLSEGS